jgi:hypothetical protein
VICRLGVVLHYCVQIHAQKLSNSSLRCPESSKVRAFFEFFDFSRAVQIEYRDWMPNLHVSSTVCTSSTILPSGFDQTSIDHEIGDRLCVAQNFNGESALDRLLQSP